MLPHVFQGVYGYWFCSTAGQQVSGIPLAENRKLFEGLSAPFPALNRSWAAENKPPGVQISPTRGHSCKLTGRLETQLQEVMFIKTYSSLITAWLKASVSQIQGLSWVYLVLNDMCRRGDGAFEHGMPTLPGPAPVAFSRSRTGLGSSVKSSCISCSCQL